MFLDILGTNATEMRYPRGWYILHLPFTWLSSHIYRVCSW